MAIVQQEFKRITQSTTGGKTAVAAASYRNGEKYIGVDGKEANFKNKDVDFHEIILPSYVEVDFDAQSLWLSADKAELNKNGGFKAVSTSAYEYQFALPRELSPSQNIELTREFTRAWVEKHGCAANPAYHHLEGKNPHVHIMITNRRMDAQGNLCEKLRCLDNKNSIKESRALFVEIMNKHLIQAGFEGNLSALSYKAQGLDIEPVKHINHDKIAMNRRLGISYEEMPEYKANAEIKALREKKSLNVSADVEPYVQQYKRIVPSDMTFRESVAQDFALVAQRKYIESERAKLESERQALIAYYDKIQKAKTATVKKQKLFGLMTTTERKYDAEYINQHVKAYKARLESYRLKEKALSRVWNFAGFDVLKPHLDSFEEHSEEMRRYISAQDYRRAYDSLINQNVEKDNPYRKEITQQAENLISIQVRYDDYSDTGMNM